MPEPEFIRYQMLNFWPLLNLHREALHRISDSIIELVVLIQKAAHCKNPSIADPVKLIEPLRLGFIRFARPQKNLEKSVWLQIYAVIQIFFASECQGFSFQIVHFGLWRQGVQWKWWCRINSWSLNGTFHSISESLKTYRKPCWRFYAVQLILFLSVSSHCVARNIRKQACQPLIVEKKESKIDDISDLFTEVVPIRIDTRLSKKTRDRLYYHNFQLGPKLWRVVKSSDSSGNGNRSPARIFQTAATFSNSEIYTVGHTFHPLRILLQSKKDKTQ